MEKKFKGTKFNELLAYVDFFTEGNKPPFFKKNDDKKDTPKEKKNNPFASKGKKDNKKPDAKKTNKGKGKVPPGLAAYLAKKKGDKNGSKSED